MGQQRAQIDRGGNAVQAAGPGDALMSQEQITLVSNAASVVLDSTAVLGGIIDRTGPTGAYGDTTPSAQAIVDGIGTNSRPSVGDSFGFSIRNTVAFANTLVAGVGVTLVNATIAASLVRDYLVTVLSSKPAQVFAASTISASATITGLTTTQVSRLENGMGVSGAGIPGSTTVLGINIAAGTVTLSANATATASLVAITFFPRVTIIGVGTRGL
jgi:hypothetical protein